MTKIINFYGGPSCGKTSKMLGVAAWMKEKRLNVEIAPEFVKFPVWEEHSSLIDNQLVLFAEQNRLLYSLLGKVDYVITDSPLLLSMVYVKKGQKKFIKNRRLWDDYFSDLVWQTYQQYENINFFIDRKNRKYVKAGRLQNKEEAVQIDNEVLKVLQKYNLNYWTVSNKNQIIDILGLKKK